MRSRTRRPRWAVTAGLAVLVAVTGACSSGSNGEGPTTAPGPRPSSTAKIQILEPANGQVIQGSSVAVRLGLTGGRIVPATTTKLRPNEGHVHIYLDNQIVAMNFGLTDDIPDVPAGNHILRAEFVASDHGPFNPRVFTAVTFTVQP